MMARHSAARPSRSPCRWERSVRRLAMRMSLFAAYPDPVRDVWDLVAPGERPSTLGRAVTARVTAVVLTTEDAVSREKVSRSRPTPYGGSRSTGVDLGSGFSVSRTICTAVPHAIAGGRAILTSCISAAAIRTLRERLDILLVVSPRRSALLKLPEPCADPWG
jgi:hypothetical protein